MRIIESSIGIDASPDVVWASIVDFEAYQEWNPFVVKGSGSAVVGTTLDFMFQLPGDKATRVRPTVRIAEPGRHLRWEGITVSRVILSGQHEFILEPAGTGTKLVQREYFRGLAVPFIDKTIKWAEQGFHDMNRALKQRAEKAAGVPQGE
ncbi:SRPBCC family protein [Kibdelosporangium aridum]|uniref:SRPBCC family protein n=1 Tax=Kibdelosporangium aridum TaxID=2030 RepID=UPI000524A257